jgi:Zn-dependent protease
MNSVATHCDECCAEVAFGLLSCPGCARLVHGRELAQIAQGAGIAEKAGDLTTALGSWRRALELLPRQSVQYETIQARMKALSSTIDGRGAPPAGVSGQAGQADGDKPGAPKAGKLAGLGAVGAALLKGKTLLLALLANGKLLLLGLAKVPTLLSLLLYARWMSAQGVGFGLGVVACIYVHEVGHVAVLRRYGIDAGAPMFVPGLGAFVRMKQYPTDAHEEARTGLAGPLWGLVAAGVAAGIGALTGSGVALSVASWSASVNLFNLIPVWQLDGARGLRALSKSERLIVAGVAAVVAFGLHQWMPALVALVAAPRAFGRDAHATGDRRMLVLFVALVVAHAAIATLPQTALLAR